MRRILRHVKMWVRLLFIFRKKVVYFGGTNNVNLGDNAQRLLISRWCRECFPGHKYVEIPIALTSCEMIGLGRYAQKAIFAAILFSILKFKQRHGDIFVTGSGYGLVDHAWNWLAYARLAESCRCTPILMMPQTINFMNPWIEIAASRAYNSHSRILMLARDFVSLEKAKRAFPKCNPIAYPDVVTWLIGTRRYDKPRDGVLFCVRDDGEAFYAREKIKAMESRFQCRVEEKDTTMQVDGADMDINREKYIDEFIEYVAGFKAVVTDRYHGTIFSVIANTPVVVISSTDHKLSSGVKWFPPEIFGRNIRFADTLDMAYEIASEYLERTEFPPLPPYFKDNYWDRLKGIVDETLLAR